MKTRDKTIQKKTIELTQKEVYEAIKDYIEGQGAFLKEGVEEINGCIVLGADTEYKIFQDHTAKIVTYYGT